MRQANLIFFSMLFSLLTLGCNLQQNLLYYPDASLPSEKTLKYHRISFWPEAGPRYKGFISLGPDKVANGTVIVFHGNAGTADERSFYAEALAPLGYRVILAEYPGYGSRKGRPAEEHFVRDAREILIMAEQNFGGPIFLLGESLGCGVAAAVAKEAPDKVSGIILITPWDDLISVAKEKFPLLPVRFFMKDKYDNLENLKGYRGKVAVIGAEKDEILPVEHARKLYDSINTDKRFWMIRDAGHNDWLNKVGAQFWQAVITYMSGE